MHVYFIRIHSFYSFKKIRNRKKKVSIKSVKRLKIDLHALEYYINAANSS